MSQHEPTAHEILADHVTNVPDVTARVIRRACEEHARLQAEVAERGEHGVSFSLETSMRALQARADELVLMNRSLSTALEEVLNRSGALCQKSNGRRPTNSRVR